MGSKYVAALIVSMSLLLSLQPRWSMGEQEGISPKIGPLLKEALLDATTGSADEPSADDSAAGASLVKAIVVMDRDHLQPLPDTIVSELRQRVEGLGGHVGGHAFNNVEVWMPLSAVEELAPWSEVALIRQPLKPQSNYAMSEGVNIVGATTFHGHGLRGSGVKIGVVDGGFRGYASLLGTDLPASVTRKVFGSESDFISEDHGTAMAEVVYDVAPEAEMFLVNYTSPAVDFVNAVSWLESQDVDVINCSQAMAFQYRMIYGCLHPSSSTGPDRDRFVSTLRNINSVVQQWQSVANHAVAQGIAWAQAAGNSGDKVWRGPFRDTDNNGLLEFSCYDPANEYNRIHIPPVSQSELNALCETYVVVKWGSGDTYSTNDDYDLYVVDDNDSVVASSTIEQGPSFPHGMEICKFGPRVGEKYFVVVERYSGSSVQEITLELYDDCYQYLDCNTPEKTVLSAPPADNPNVITVGAVSWSSPSTIERMSSRGPNAHGIVKPDLVAPTNVTTSNPSFHCGATSCAAPHVAGACALLKEAHPSWSPGQIKSSLESNAVDLGPAGKDNTYGSGRVSLAGIALPGVTTPTVSTKAASSVTETSATLNGTVNPNGESTTYYFEYGTTASYGASTSEMTAGSGNNAVSVSADVSGLTEDTTYHFRLVAMNDNGTTYGKDVTFGGAAGAGGGGGGGGGCFIGTVAESL